jgi:FMN phosphatase YigB (HAD superfamily)
MLKTIIFRCENVILNDDYLQFKIYEKLWHYLRQDPAWSDFETVLKLREYYVSEQRSTVTHPVIASRHLSTINQLRFAQDIQLFLKKHSRFYLRLLPGMSPIVRNLKFYYKIVLIAQPGSLYQEGDHKYHFERLFHFTFLQEKTTDLQLFQNFLRNIILKTRSSENEILLVSDQLYPDLRVAEKSGIITLQIFFDPKTRGFQPQNYLEWQYYHSLTRLHKQKARNLTGKKKIDMWANNPSEVSNIISNLERSGVHSPAAESSKSAGEVTFWDLAREVFNTPGPSEED